MNTYHQCDEDKNVYDVTTSEEPNVEKVECVNCQECHWPAYHIANEFRL